MINFTTGTFEELIVEMEAKKFQRILQEITNMETLENGETIVNLNIVADNLDLTIEEVGRFLGIDKHGNILPTEYGHRCMMTMTAQNK